MTATELDRLALGPDAAYSGAAPAPPKAPPRHKGDVELGLDTDLRTMPRALRLGTLARTARRLARTLDAGGMTPRDEATMARELRMHVNDLIAMAPGERKGDSTDEVQARRERRLEADRQAAGE